MKAIVVIAISLCAAVVLAADNKAEMEVRQRYAEYVDAVKKMDSAKYLTFFRESFSMKSPDGKEHDRAEMLRYQKVNAETTKKVNSYTLDIENVSQLANGDVAVIVLQKYDRDQAPMDKPSESHRIETSVVQREIWRKDAGAWKLNRTEEILSGPVFMDGKIYTQ